MRRPFIAAVAVAVLSAFSGVAGSPVSASRADVARPAATHPDTVRIVVRPITAHGHRAAGYKETREPSDVVDCRTSDESEAALSRNVERCSPSASSAVACWRAAAAHHVFCIRDPSKKKVVKLPRSGKFAHSEVVPRNQRAPLLLVLMDGTKCFIRDGGAWGSLKHHGSWTGTYGCNHHGAVWSPPGAWHDGVNETHPSWTVRTAGFSGTQTLHTRHVRKAYFVATKH